MIPVAFSIGFFGSLHCIGMCGPLAIFACSSSQGNSASKNGILSYQIGRIITYSFLGLIFGFLSDFFYISSFQKFTAIFCGFVLMFSVLFSLNLDASIQKSFLGKFISNNVSLLLNNYFDKFTNKSPFVIGLINGLLPCGLVYLAIAGAIVCETPVQSGLFMLAFGVGTVPAMIGLLTGYSRLPFLLKKWFNKSLPYVTFTFGLFMIYRGIIIDVPLELDFYGALQNPIMCH